MSSDIHTMHSPTVTLSLAMSLSTWRPAEVWRVFSRNAATILEGSPTRCVSLDERPHGKRGPDVLAEPVLLLGELQGNQHENGPIIPHDWGK